METRSAPPNLLSPHVCRAITISDVLNLKTIRSEALERPSTHLPQAFILPILLAASSIQTARRNSRSRRQCAPY